MITGQNLTKVPNLTELQKLSIEAQNGLIQEIFENQLKLKIKEISRDREGHIYVFTIKDNQVNAYVCAFDTLNKCITNYKVGRLDFKEIGAHGYVDVLRVHRAFLNKGLGTLLLQVFENYLIDRNKEFIELMSMKTFEDTSKNHYDIKLIEKNMNETYREAYIKKYFHDINYYFYSTLGYVKVNNYPSFVKMKKENLRKICLKYGLEKTKLNHKDDIMPTIMESMVNYSSFLQVATTAQKRDFFHYDVYGTPSENMYPLTLQPVYDDFAKLYNILKKSTITLTPEYEDYTFTNPEINNSCYSRIVDLDKLNNLISDYNEANLSVSNLSEEEISRLKNVYNNYIARYQVAYLAKQSSSETNHNLYQNSSSTESPVEKQN